MGVSAVEDDGPMCWRCRALFNIASRVMRFDYAVVEGGLR